jgi:hypothetical protein
MPLRRWYPIGVGVVVGAALLIPGPALASPTPTVTFSGGCGVRGAGAASEPDAVSLAVPAEGLVVFVNHLGATATLLVDDRPAGTLRVNEQVSVVFHHGPVTVKLAPACLPAVDADPVYVAVAARGPAASPSVAAPAYLGSQDPPAPALHRRGASKILVLVAAICVVGVSFATIRAIIAQRAIRTASA